MECLLIVRCTSIEKNSAQGGLCREKNRLRHSIHHGCLSRGLHSVHTNSIKIRWASAHNLSRSPEPEETFTFFVEVQHPQEPPSHLFFQSKSPLPYVTGSYVTPLSNVHQSSGQDQIFHLPTVKFHHPSSTALIYPLNYPPNGISGLHDITPRWLPEVTEYRALDFSEAMFTSMRLQKPTDSQRFEGFRPKFNRGTGVKTGTGVNMGTPTKVAIGGAEEWPPGL
ncbi:hypothetical protein AVEN_209295-1 [Araneus ventricosus]|uniref:Uncharacterized protein n=1 Tax=Araneus ventricosus TaxID=182803 RepID=A0A4Y2CB87_ARAVE|nr:hypothetical protein AVEN_209295-1 [Araneus ventricosus]